MCSDFVILPQFEAAPGCHKPAATMDTIKPI